MINSGEGRLASSNFRSVTNAAGLPNSWVLLFARLAVAPLFLYSGVAKIFVFSVIADSLYGGSGGSGALLAVGAIMVELGCSLALALGLLVRPAAIVLIAFTVVVTFMFHRFWASPEAQVSVQTVNFLKNLGLLGALAFIAHYGSGPYTVRTIVRRG